MSTHDSAQLAALLDEARRGDMGARGRLIERYRNYLTLLARMQLDQELHRKEGGSDAVQQTFLEAVRDFDQFHGATHEEFGAWLRRILARNLADLIRRYRGTAARDIRLEEHLDEQLDRSSATMSRGLAARGPSPSDYAIKSEESLLLADALAQLPEHYQKVIVLRNVEGLTFPVIAQQMGRSVDSAKNLWFPHHYARGQLPW